MNVAGGLLWELFEQYVDYINIFGKNSTLYYTTIDNEYLCAYTKYMFNMWSVSIVYNYQAHLVLSMTTCEKGSSDVYTWQCIIYLDVSYL